MRFPVLTGPQTPVQFAQRFEMGVHEGIDVFAPAGAELVAIEAGRVRQDSTARGGHVVYLTTADGTQYYYAHLDAFAHPLMPGETRLVDEGDSLGYVGTSGNAKGKAPHLHLEVRPRGGSKVDPFPLLTRLARAEEQRVVLSPRPSARARPVSKPRPKKRRRTPVVRPVRSQQEPLYSGGGAALIVVFALAVLAGRMS